MLKTAIAFVAAVFCVTAHAGSFYEDSAKLIEPEDQHGKYVNCAAMANLIFLDTGNVNYQKKFEQFASHVKEAGFDPKAIYLATTVRGSYFIGITDYHRQIYKKELDLTQPFKQGCGSL